MQLSDDSFHGGTKKKKSQMAAGGAEQRGHSEASWHVKAFSTVIRISLLICSSSDSNSFQQIIRNGETCFFFVFVFTAAPQKQLKNVFFFK